MVITKLLDEETVANVERYAYEYEARKSVISEMLSQNMDISTEAFEKYQKEMVKFKVLFENAKQEVENTFVKDIENWKDWHLDYTSKILTVNIGDNK